jgi:DNA-binding NarL/FixJ family response regulator
MHSDPRLLEEAFRCGASGYVLKQSAGDELILAIEKVLAGAEYVTPLMRLPSSGFGEKTEQGS